MDTKKTEKAGAAKVAVVKIEVRKLDKVEATGYPSILFVVR
ncbi:hypothetical protein [Kitasatospora acidiphila]|nr:hypothetical protein [Kitasatospora acidiphila]